MFDGKRYWLVGASEGLGRALAQALDAQGARLVLSARSAERLAELAQTLNAPQLVPMDVTDADSVASASALVGAHDGIIYCAGFYEPIAAQAWQSAPIEAMAEVNFVGALRVLGHSVPQFVAANAGHIVLIGSLAGFRGLPGAIGYGASKAGVMHLGETLYADLRKTGVRVQVVNPGFIATRLTEKNRFDMPQLMSAQAAAAQVIAAMRSQRFSTSFPRPFSLLFTLGRYLPFKVFSRLFG
jgi:short-subunit dehydrogenase